MSAAITVCDWIRSADGPVLLAIDAPLGWPAAMGPTLSTHSAGDEITVAPNTMFRRATDRFFSKSFERHRLMSSPIGLHVQPTLHSRFSEGYAAS
jgi:hypothetical protein